MKPGTSARYVCTALVVLAALGAACGGSSFESGVTDGGAEGGALDATTSSDVVIVVMGPDSGGDADATIGEAGSPEAASETGASETGATEAGQGSADGATEAGGDAAADAAGCAAGEVCATAAPSGWSGPVQFYYGASPAPTCPPSTTAGFDGGTSLSAPAAACSTCSCSGAVTCPNTEVTFYLDSSCTGATCVQATVVGSVCTGATDTCGENTPPYFQIQSTPSGAACSPSTQSPTLPPLSWGSVAQECNPVPAADSCGAGQVCTAAPASPYQLCIYQAGNSACPANGPYSEKQLVDTSVADDRSCTACSCGVPTGTACSGGALSTQPPSTACDAGLSPVSVPTACTMANIGGFSPIYFVQTTLPAPSTSSCEPSGGQPTGAATAGTPMTICCAP